MIRKVLIFGASDFSIRIARQIINSDFFELVGIIYEDNRPEIGDLNSFLVGNKAEEIFKINPDFALALDYHKIIATEIVNSFVIFNSHGGLLPNYRGYHGLGWSFINGEEEIGYTLHKMDDKLDNGQIIYQYKKKINSNTTFNDLKNDIYLDLEKNILTTIFDYFDNKLIPVDQDETNPIYVAKRKPIDCFIDWEKPSAYIHLFIRSLSPDTAPGAFTVFNSKKMIILNSEIYNCKDYIEVPGHVVFIEEERVLVKTGDTCIWIKDVIYDGEKCLARQLFKSPGARLGVNLIEQYLVSKGII